jgi:hypothetical protein
MQDVDTASQTTTKAGGKSPPLTVPLNERAAFTPAEFAALFGKQETWAYRQVYAGRVRVIRQLGRMMIPRTELERLSNDAAEYEPSATTRARRKAKDALA